MDGVWLRLQGKNHKSIAKQEMKVSTIYEGWEETNRKTSRLCGKKVLAGMEKNNEFHEKREAQIRSMLQAVVGASSILYALLLLRGVIDEAVRGNYTGFRQYLFWFVGLIVLQIALRGSIRFMEEHMSSSYENRLKEHLFAVLLSRDYGMVAAVHSGEWMNRLTSDTVVVAEGLVTIVPGFLGMLVKIVGVMWMLFRLEPRFGYLLIPGGLLVIGFTYAFRKVPKRLHKRMQMADGKVRIHLQEHIESLMIVKTFAREGQSLQMAKDRLKEYHAIRLKKNLFSNLCNIGFSNAINGAYVSGVIYCGYGILNHTISYGTLMAVLRLISQIQVPIANITGYVPKNIMKFFILLEVC